MLSRNWAFFLEEKGPGTNRIKPDEATIAAYKDRLPDDFLEVWREIGWSSVLGGMLRITDPSLFDDILKLAFKGDRDFRPEDCVIFAYTVFGRLYGLHSLYGAFEIDLLTYEMSAPKYLDQSKRPNPSAAVLASLDAVDPKEADPRDEGTSRPLFSKAVKALGLPDGDECYGFVPALPLGGVRRLSALRRMKAVEHFTLLIQIQPLVLMDYRAFPATPVRSIG